MMTSNVFGTITAENLAYAKVSLEETITKGQAWHGEFKNLAKDGSEYYLDVNIEADFDENNNLIGYTAIRQDITDKKSIEALSERDTLTNLYNRLKLDKVINQELERASRYDSLFSVMIVDIDYFKAVNDTYGHLVGDQTLVELANILMQRTRKIDIVGRWGGEEFLIICPETNRHSSQELAEDICQAIRVHDFPEIGKLTCSFGVSECKIGDNYSILLNSADEALYEAKSSGRDQVEVAER